MVKITFFFGSLSEMKSLGRYLTHVGLDQHVLIFPFSSYVFFS